MRAAWSVALSAQISGVARRSVQRPILCQRSWTFAELAGEEDPAFAGAECGVGERFRDKLSEPPRKRTDGKNYASRIRLTSSQ